MQAEGDVKTVGQTSNNGKPKTGKRQRIFTKKSRGDSANSTKDLTGTYSIASIKDRIRNTQKVTKEQQTESKEKEGPRQDTPNQLSSEAVENMEKTEKNSEDRVLGESIEKNIMEKDEGSVSREEKREEFLDTEEERERSEDLRAKIGEDAGRGAEKDMSVYRHRRGISSSNGGDANPSMSISSLLSIKSLEQTRKKLKEKASASTRTWFVGDIVKRKSRGVAFGDDADESEYSDELADSSVLSSSAPSSALSSASLSSSELENAENPEYNKGEGGYLSDYSYKGSSNPQVNPDRLHPQSPVNHIATSSISAIGSLPAQPPMAPTDVPAEHKTPDSYTVVLDKVYPIHMPLLASLALYGIPIPTEIDTKFGTRGLVSPNDVRAFGHDFLSTCLMKDIHIGQWSAASNGEMDVKYLRPLGYSIGPKSAMTYEALCILYLDYSTAVVAESTVRTPEVPSGSSFVVKVRYCFTWQSHISARLVVSYSIVWSKSSWIKAPVESATAEGNKSHYAAFDSALTSWLSSHPALVFPPPSTVPTPPQPSGLTLELLLEKKLSRPISPKSLQRSKFSSKHTQSGRPTSASSDSLSTSIVSFLRASTPSTLRHVPSPVIIIYSLLLIYSFLHFIIVPRHSSLFASLPTTLTTTLWGNKFFLAISQYTSHRLATVYSSCSNSYPFPLSFIGSAYCHLLESPIVLALVPEKQNATNKTSKMYNVDNLKKVIQLSPRVFQISGCNPGPFTLQGSNTYLVGTGSRRILIDTGEGQISSASNKGRNSNSHVEYRTNLKNLLQQQGDAKISTILITHWHNDHVGGIPDILADSSMVTSEVNVYKRFVDGYEEKWGILPSSGIRWGLIGANSSVLQDSLSAVKEKRISKADGMFIDKFTTEGATLLAIDSSGHTLDHTSFYLLEEQSLFTGDSILGNSSTIFENLRLHLQSLAKYKDLHAIRAIYPGHGPSLVNSIAEMHGTENIIQSIERGEASAERAQSNHNEFASYLLPHLGVDNFVILNGPRTPSPPSSPSNSAPQNKSKKQKVFADDCFQVVDSNISHRIKRENEIVEILSSLPESVSNSSDEVPTSKTDSENSGSGYISIDYILTRLYDSTLLTNENLKRGATHSVRLHLQKLIDEGRVTSTPDNIYFKLAISTSL
ncbi:Beta-lactamase-like protein 2 [Zancudomyces culisetae]|uniref:Beta-lactamase-like protein 2 n=1 Tax=Zancudomyces culisetae TaxID=1213189 RepID=A0A1R1PEW6_ZANCU|nr:Beta-lactamase-like protein 2 [Zancudomyces culisetae]|eukprot:OMH79507.1 Beta-lactamase-like protein 2 [Zancudomyces culisetae]